MDTLTELAINYGADKWGKHTYTPVYFDLFKDRRETVKKVIEIGIGEGASLRMWRDFFPNATIYGADNDLERSSREYGFRIEPIRCDQTSQDDFIDLINLTDSDIDLFVDDGSHKPEDQIFTCLQIFPALDTGAIYVIEDVSDPGIVEKFKRYNPEVLKVGKRYDDRLIIIKKL